MTPRRGVLVLLATAPLTGRAQQQPRRVGVLGNTASYGATTEWRVFVDQLARLGFVEGRNVVFVHRYAGSYAEPEASVRMRAEAQDLVRSGVDVIYAVDDGSSATTAQQVTRTVPIVFDRSWRDPVAIGLVDSLARPGGNVTGNSVLGLQIEIKAIEVLISALGPLTAVAVLRTSMLASWPGFEPLLAQRRARARELGVELVQFEVDTVDALPAVLQRIDAAGIRAVKFDDPEGFDTRRREVVMCFERQGLVGLSTEVEYARQGLLLGFGLDLSEVARRSARYVAKILKGARPADLPVEQIDKVQLVVNRRAAQTLGLRLPQALLLRADEVIG